MNILEKESCQQHRVPEVFGKFREKIALFLGNVFIIERLTLFSKSLEDLNQKEGEDQYYAKQYKPQERKERLD